MAATENPAFQFGSFSIAGCAPFAGVVKGEQVVAIQALKSVCTRLGLPLSGAGDLHALLQDWDRNLASVQAALAVCEQSQFVPLSMLRLHAPVLRPGQIVCTGANYRQHVIDLIVAQGGGATTQGMTVEQRRADAAALMDKRAADGTPYAWIKAGSALAGPNDALALPAYTTQPDWELELGVVIGRPAYRVSRTEALDCVAGYMVVNDVTARDCIYRPDLKVIGTDWMTGKGAPGFLPCGPYLVPRAFVPDPYALRIRLELNGQVMQDESTSDMIFSIERQLEHISAHIRLEPGDILCTGSPAGNGAHYGRFLRPGDVMRGSITGLGTQNVPCVGSD